ncbi:hypothetical protein DL96DRAFT_1709174 [Flagelloscypha sp. PMI_526]|nr:hypothetical protein DL96DRAFT_1709174 [Flagelloscypha sp. PMI_526]
MASNFDSKEVPLSTSSLPNYNAIYLVPRPAEQRRPSHFRRILRGSLWILFTLFIGFHVFPSVFAVINGFAFHHDDIPIPSRRIVLSCDAHEGLGSSTTFQLPLDAKLLFLESEGASQGGHVTITSSKDVANDVALVYVTSRPSHQRSSVHAKVCHTERNGEHGVGIYSPRRGGWAHGMNFEVRLVFPEHAVPALVKALATSMHNYKIDLELGDAVSFETLHLGTTNSKITYNGPKLFVSKTLTVKSTNGGIFGNFNSSNTLYLETSNAPIEVDVILNSSRNSANPTSAIFRTSNGRIIASYDLLSADSTGGSFTIHSRTSNSKTALDIKTAPVDSTMNIISHTSNSLNEVSVPSAFEGNYVLETSNAIPEIKVSEKEDPSGRGRERKIDQKYISRGHAFGTIGWSDEGKTRGNLHIKSSNAKVILTA